MRSCIILWGLVRELKVLVIGLGGWEWYAALGMQCLCQPIEVIRGFLIRKHIFVNTCLLGCCFEGNDRAMNLHNCT